MNAFPWPVDAVLLAIGATVAVAALAAGIFGRLWLGQRRRADKEGARAEAALAKVSDLAAERASLAARCADLEDQVAALRVSIDQAERNPSRLAVLFLRNRAAETGVQMERVEAALAAERPAFAAAVDAAAAGNGDYRSRRAVDADLDKRRRTIAEREKLRERLRAQGKRIEGFADDLSRDAFDVAPWRREVDSAVGSADRLPGGPYHAPGWLDLVDTVRREHPPEEPAPAAMPEPR